MRKLFMILLSIGAVSVTMAETAEIKVDLKLCGDDFVVGERIRGIVDIANSSPSKVSVGYSNSKDVFFI